MASRRGFDLAEYFPAREAVRYALTRRGFFSEFNILVYACADALAAGRHLYIDERKFPTPWDELFANGPPDMQDLDPARYDAVIELHAKATRTEWSEMRRRVRDACLRGDRVSVAGLGFEGRFDELVFTVADRLFTPRQTVIDQALAAERAMGLDCAPYCAVQIRRGDKTEGYLNAKGRLVVETQAVPFAVYAERLAAIAPDLRDVFVLTDDYGAYEAVAADHPEYRFHTLCEESERGYRHADHMDRSPDEQLAAVRKLLVSVIVARRSAAFVGTHWSNLSTAVYMLHAHKASCACIDEDQEWPPFDPMFLPGRPPGLGHAAPPAAAPFVNS